MRYSSYEFYSLLRDCYFHPSRNKEYPCEMMKRKTKAALITLWNTEHLKILGKEYDGDAIRRILIDEMMPEDVDRAVSFYMHRVADKTVLNLSITIFLSVILRETIIDLMYRYHEHGEIPVDAYVTVTLELTA